MSKVSDIAARRPARAEPADKFDPGERQTVLVFQGGGALGAYQAGVYQALHEAGIEPDWIIGTSIGAINAALIAGKIPHDPGEHVALVVSGGNVSAETASAILAPR